MECFIIDIIFNFIESSQSFPKVSHKNVDLYQTTNPFRHQIGWYDAALSAMPPNLKFPKISGNFTSLLNKMRVAHSLPTQKMGYYELIKDPSRNGIISQTYKQT